MVSSATSGRLAVIGAGWAGIAAAIEAHDLGHAVTLFEMASQPGGRARQVPGNEEFGGVDNGQHILIGAYRETLALMQRVGVDPAKVLLRLPLAISYPDGDGLVLPPGPAIPAFVRGVLGQRHWSLRDRFALLWAAGRWRLQGFECAPDLSVADLTAGLPSTLRKSLIDPLCIAALNTPSEVASAAVFLRILRDALFAGPGAADMLLPRVRLSALLPTPAVARLAQAGAQIRSGTRVRKIQRGSSSGWLVDEQPFEHVIVATSSTEAARLTAELDPRWSSTSLALRHEPIVTLSFRSAGTRLSLPLLALHADAHTRPAQFVFDQGQLGAAPGILTLVISGAADWLERGNEVMVAAARDQLIEQLGDQLLSPPDLMHSITDKRATFRCSPGLQRPSMQIASGLLAAGDYIAGPYPATLEGAVQSGLAAARAIPGKAN